MRLRSLLFVPGDRADRFASAANSGADAIIIDLEDAVSAANKGIARSNITAYLRKPRSCCTLVRINSWASGLAEEDLASLREFVPDGIVLPKAEGAHSIAELLDLLGQVRLPILPIATETASAIFELGTYAQFANNLLGLTWGVEDLAAAIGATTLRELDGSYTAPIQLARSLTLFGAHKAGIPAIETVFADIRDMSGLEAYAARGRRDGFSGMLAIHPSQVPVINAAFSPSEAELDDARAVLSAFEANKGTAAIQLNGRLLDAPHLKTAKRLLGLSQ